jgi:ornithine cyclodeaminase/alanine dehydrogenase-like protein (mu-crystallin family)
MTIAAPPLLTLCASDLVNLTVTTDDVLDAVEQGYRQLAGGVSDNPGKLTVACAERGSVAYSMLGRDGGTQTMAFKTSYKFDPDTGRGTKRYYTTLTLYDDTTGLPVALMDCGRIGALRTPAVSALAIRACATPAAATALVIGSGTQGRHALPFVVNACPQLRDLLVYGTHADGLAAVREEFSSQHPERTLTVIDDLEQAVRRADVIVAAAGPATSARVPVAWLKPGVVTVLVGYGLASSTLTGADFVIATSAEQMRTTGTDMAGPGGVLREVDAELPDVLVGRAPARRSATDRVFIYNSGLVITDIALGLLFVQRARQQRLGAEIALWS